ncbi:MAG: glycosyltransferase family 1 protein [Betaproteobacteria bacterium]|nr:MAG: glycosyltransferase family 1 protein [Betaproteobacteria bacterium]
MKVRTIPVQPHCFHFGGFDIQMHRTHELLRRHGIDAQPLDFWSKDNDWDVLHLWGLGKGHQEVVRIAKAHGKKVVLSALLPYMNVETWLRHFASLAIGVRRSLLDILRHTDKLLVHNDLQVETAVRMFWVPREKVAIIPSILDPFFFSPQPERPFDDLRDYVACVGNIWPRKNQVRLAKAARQVKCPMMFIGNTMGGEESYTAEFEELVRTTPFFRWYKWVSFEDIRRVYFNAIGVALPSFTETQPGCAFEGSAMGKPLLLGDRPYAYQKYFRGAYLATATSVSSIANGLTEIRLRPESYTPSKTLMAECHPDLISLELKQIFESLVA